MKQNITRRAALAALSSAAAVAFPGLSLAQADRPVKFILPNATGSGVDAITRAAAPAIGKALGANVVVENQAGASGVIGLQAMAKNPPDGLTLSVVSNNVVIFIAALRAKPDGYNFGSGGTGTILHLAAEMFVDEARVKARHIPYKGVGPMVTDLLGGQIDFAVLALPSVQQHIKSGALKAVGMCGDKRSAAAPDIPTFVEQGLPTYVIDAWFGVLGPKGMSAATVKKVNDALVQAFNDPAVKETMAKQGNTIAISTPEHAHDDHHPMDLLK